MTPHLGYNLARRKRENIIVFRRGGGGGGGNGPVPYTMTISTGGWVSRKCEKTVSTLLRKQLVPSPSSSRSQAHGKLWINCLPSRGFMASWKSLKISLSFCKNLIELWYLILVLWSPSEPTCIVLKNEISFSRQFNESIIEY